MWNSLHQYRHVLTLPHWAGIPGSASLAQGLVVTCKMGSLLGTLFPWNLLLPAEWLSNSKREIIWCSLTFEQCSSWHSSIQFGSPEGRKENWRDVLRCPLGEVPFCKFGSLRETQKGSDGCENSKNTTPDVLPYDIISLHTNY